MHLKVGASAEGRAIIPCPVTFLCGEYGISVYGRGEDGLITRLEVCKRFAPSPDILPRFDTTPDSEVKAHISIPASPHEDDLFELLQYLESLGSFWLDLRSVGWQDAKIEWIPESSDEKALLGLYSARRTRSFPDPPRQFDPRRLRSLIANRERHKRYLVPMSFLREGNREYLEFRFANAFCQYYFFLEGLYANGKWRSEAVQREFLASLHLRDAARATLGRFTTAPSSIPTQDIERRLGTHGWSLGEENLLKLLVTTRGELHHFSLSSSKPQATPLNQEQFQHVAFLAFHVCMTVYPLLLRDDGPK